MSVSAENTSETPATRDSERSEEPTNEISQDFWINWSKKVRHLIFQRRILVLSRHSRDAHSIMKLQSLEPRRQVRSGVRDFRLTVSKTIKYFKVIVS